MNQLQIVATIAEREILRYSPAGIPIVSAVLLHSSQQTEAGVSRLTEFEIAALAAGEISGRFDRAELGRTYRFTGFLARKNRNSKSLVFHLTDFEEPHLDTGAKNGIR
ncbi:MAG: primosomal replication protein N [Oxalicibacterium faecigallinarum]|uniref:Replication restart protein PriB n=1 Tax=Oxalicibacterium faecigallinarum TaxID=573741 RepID=A0A8J3F1T2_9BURK|nr:primosomal replication protein N [Oxalicibacterium faecigallinarum]MDQ7968392.1 primosomal replication protein N [Oxalicibacterium faecigallinarum]GGI17692.1 primosomal replication protein N [Oxalicibacterium faecigallinarum]